MPTPSLIQTKSTIGEWEDDRPRAVVTDWAGRGLAGLNAVAGDTLLLSHWGQNRDTAGAPGALDLTGLMAARAIIRASVSPTAKIYGMQDAYNSGVAPTLENVALAKLTWLVSLGPIAYVVVDVDTVGKTFTVAHRYDFQFTAGNTLEITDSTGKDGYYTVAPAGAVWDADTDTTEIAVVETIGSAVVDGTLIHSALASASFSATDFSLTAWVEYSIVDAAGREQTILPGFPMRILNQADDGAVANPASSAYTYLTAAEIAAAYWPRATSITATPTLPTGLVATIQGWFDRITYQVKAITGATNWYDVPATTLAAVSSYLSTVAAHLANTSNPHSTTAAQVGALPTAGGTMAGNIAMGGNLVTGLGAPVSGSDAATKTYTDNLAAGAKWKTAVRAATTVAGTLATSFEAGDTIDGVVLATGNRILIKNQASAVENGIYVVAASGAPTRATDLASGADASSVTLAVSEGTTNGDFYWRCPEDAGSAVVGTNAITFTAFAATLSAHAASHQHGGADEVATATPGANAIPKAGAGGRLAIGWLASGTPDGTKFVADDGVLRVPAGGGDVIGAGASVDMQVTVFDGTTGDTLAAPTNGPKINTSTGLMTFTRAVLMAAGSSIASAATIDLATATGNTLHVTGSTGPVTSLGTVQAGAEFTLICDSTPTFTHHATNLILPGGANFTAAAGDILRFGSDGGGAWRLTGYRLASGRAMVAGSRVGVYRYTQIDAGAMKPATTNGATAVDIETTTNKVGYDGYTFEGTSGSADKHVWFKIDYTPEMDLSSGFKVKLKWKAPSGATAGHLVRFYVAAVAVSDDDPVDAALGTAVNIDDAVLAAGDLHVTTASGAITAAGTPAEGDTIYVRVSRDYDYAGGGTGMSGAAELQGAVVEIKESATEPAGW